MLRLYREGVPNSCELIYNVCEGKTPKGLHFKDIWLPLKFNPFGVIGKVELSALHSVQKYLYLVNLRYIHTKDTSL